MPELPEVESIRVQLERFLVGHTIVNFELRITKYGVWDRTKLIGAKITSVRRFGKVLVMDLSNGYSIVTHVKMTGQFIYRNKQKTENKKLSPKVVGGVPGLPAEAYVNPERLKEGVAKAGKHTHVIFHLDDPPSHKATEGQGAVLYFNDYRRFGWMELTQSSKVKTQNFIKKLGKEFLRDLREKDFSEILSKSKKPIKILLMDQTKMAGVGNIYANDALWLAGINPKEKAIELSSDRVIKLFKAIETVLKEGIKKGGASEQAFVTPDGSEGHYQDFTLVYGREGEPCNRCKTPIVKIKLGGRGTYMCPNCQK